MPDHPLRTRFRLRDAVIVMSIILGHGAGIRAADDEFFEKQVRPLLVKRCYACHSGTKAGGGLSLESAVGWKRGGESGPAIVPGKPEASLLIDAINYRNNEMPPADAGGKLSADEIAVLTKWVALGAHDPRQERDGLGGMGRDQARTWWAFQPLPAVKPAPQPTEIDAFLQSAQQQHGLKTSGKADKRTWIRRTTYDLTGLPPSPEEADAFVADESPDAVLKVIDRMLDSPQYGVHWGRHWLDVVRYADTAGENTDRPLPHAWRYRNWVAEAFRRDLPFDQFVRLQLAGDILSADAGPDERAEGIIATGYLALARRFGHDIDKDIHLTHEDVIDNLGKNFLGLTLGCARCHDHKYDPVTATDYYALYGIFGSTRLSFPGCEPKGQPRDLVSLLPKAETEAVLAAYQQRLQEYEQQSQTAGKESQRLKPLASAASRVIAEAAVSEGQTVSLEPRDKELERITVRAGEVLQLVILPGANHGADTTRVELEITRHCEVPMTWNVAELIPQFTANGPMIEQQGATWCLLDLADGPTYLHEKKTGINGQGSLSAWAIGDTPSALVNASADPVTVWTKLPGQAFFLHPGHQRNVATAWVCPIDGEYQIKGAVTDAHPAGLDGVSFRLEHIASTEYGAGLIALGKLASQPKAKPQGPTMPVAYAAVEAEAKNVRLHQRGDPEQPGDEIPRRWLSVFGGAEVTPQDGSGRRMLAEQIVQNPLFARVMVNRLWQWHFGRGLVATPNDFGARGEPPTHPELLDWLAAQFQAGGYRIKPLHRLIMQTAAYQRDSMADADQLEHDPDNRWLTRFSRRRLAAEEIRDSLLLASGRLDLTMAEAHPFPPEAGWTFTQHNPFNAVYDTNRRSLFLMVQRQRRHPYLALFDGADPNSSTAARQATTVPTQALYFLNDPFFHDQAAACATMIEQLPDEPSRLRSLFRRLFHRDPTASETDIARQFLHEYPGDPHDQWSAYVRVLMASNEFLYVD